MHWNHPRRAVGDHNDCCRGAAACQAMGSNGGDSGHPGAKSHPAGEPVLHWRTIPQRIYNCTFGSLVSFDRPFYGGIFPCLEAPPLSLFGQPRLLMIHPTRCSMGERTVLHSTYLAACLVVLLGVG